jgi:cytochrome c
MTIHFIDPIGEECNMRKAIAGAAMGGILMLAAGAASAGLDDAAALGVMKKSGCSACHSVDKKVVGPAYKDVALKRKGEKDAAATLEKSVRTGSKGTYGAIPMPPNAASKISDGDLHSLVEWILTK